MIQICRTKKEDFIVVNVGKNGEVLKSSEPLSSKQNCWKNIKSEIKNCFYCNSSYHEVLCLVQDNTLKNPVVYLVGKKRVIAHGIKPQKPHVPK